VAPVGFSDFADPTWLRTMRDLGCRSAQLYRNRNVEPGGKPISARDMRDYLAAAGLPCDSLHGLYGNDIDVSSPDESARRRAVEVFRGEGELALDVGGPLVVVHCSGTGEQPVSADEHAARRDQLRRSIADLAEIGREIGVRYAFENLPGYHRMGSDTGELTALLAEVEEPSAGLCFDVAHSFLVGDPVADIARTAGRMIYVHACDNHGRSDEHLMPYQGKIPWSDVARALAAQHYDGVVMLESFRNVDELIRLRDQNYGENLADFLRIANGG
jgi:sugar phosphate isomerase/epimerase